MTTTHRAVLEATLKRLKDHADIHAESSDSVASIEQLEDSFTPRDASHILVEVRPGALKYLDLERVSVRIHVLRRDATDSEGDSTNGTLRLLDLAEKVKKVLHNSYLDGLLTTALRYGTTSRPARYKPADGFWYCYVDLDCGAETGLPSVNTALDGTTADRG